MELVEMVECPGEDRLYEPPCPLREVSHAPSLYGPRIGATLLVFVATVVGGTYKSLLGH